MNVKHLLSTVAILLVILAVFGGIMFGLNFHTAPLIEENNKAHTLKEAELDANRQTVQESLSRAILEIRKQIAAEWLSNNEYQMINAPEIAVYHWGIVGGYPDRTIEIWIPIEKK